MVSEVRVIAMNHGFRDLMRAIPHVLPTETLNAGDVLGVRSSVLIKSKSCLERLKEYKKSPVLEAAIDYLEKQLPIEPQQGAEAKPEPQQGAQAKPEPQQGAEDKPEPQQGEGAKDKPDEAKTGEEDAPEDESKTK